MSEQQLYAAADAAIARADALSFAAVGKQATDAMFVAQWTADSEVAEACRAASRVGPASYRAKYAAITAQFATYAQLS
jgi:hypothetical protein